MVWSGDDPAKPLGKTVSTPPVTRSSTWTCRPSTVISGEFFRQLVSKSTRPGFGPSERISGKSSTTPITDDPRRKRPPSTLRRFTSMPPRSTMALVMALRSSSVEWKS